MASHRVGCSNVNVFSIELFSSNTTIVGADFRPMRKQVFDVSGQYYVPVLKDGDTILSETHEILAHLETHYAKPTE